MKKLLSLLTVLTISACLYAQTQVQVPRQVTQAFKDANMTHDYITWSMEGSNYKAFSTDANGMKNVTVFDPNGSIVRKEVEMSAKDVPSAIKGYFTNTYPNDTDYKVWMVEDNSGNRTYTSTKNDTKILFNKDGEIIKQ